MDDHAGQPADAGPPTLPGLTTPVGGIWRVPDGWQQGRGCWGGLTLGMLVRAAQDLEADPARRPRSLAAQLLGPVPPGEWRVEVEQLRRGSATTAVAVRLLGRDAGADGRPGDGDPRVLVQGVATLGEPRHVEPEWVSASTEIDPPAALAAGWQSLPVVDLRPPVIPIFIQHLELRVVGGVPYLGRPEAAVVAWVRPRAVQRSLDEAALVSLIDTAWPALSPRLPAPRPMATLTTTTDLTADPSGLPLDDVGAVAPLLSRSRLLAVWDGYTVEQRELWSADGRLLALNTQTIALIR